MLRLLDFFQAAEITSSSTPRDWYGRADGSAGLRGRLRLSSGAPCRSFAQDRANRGNSGQATPAVRIDMRRMRKLEAPACAFIQTLEI